VATSLLEIEPRLRELMGYRHLPKLRDALRREINPETKKPISSKRKAA
jgi:hypothetical protein